MPAKLRSLPCIFVVMVSLVTLPFADNTAQGQAESICRGLAVSLTADDLIRLISTCGAAEVSEETLKLIHKYAAGYGHCPADGDRSPPPRIPERKIRRDFSASFEFVWLRDIHLESRNPDVTGPSAWSIHLTPKDD